MPGNKPGKEKRMRTEYKTNLLTPYDYQEMRRTMTQTQIAERYGITLSALWKWGIRHNVILSRITDWEIAEEIWSKTPKQIAADYNVSVQTVYKKLSTMGICTKQDGQR